MGYRLCCECGDVSYYGTKHYGYTFGYADDGAKEFASVRYLVSIGKISEDDFWDYGMDNEFVLTAKQFDTWIRLYAEEWRKLQNAYSDWPPIRKLLEEPDMKKLLLSDGDKKISWF